MLVLVVMMLMMMMMITTIMMMMFIFLYCRLLAYGAILLAYGHCITEDDGDDADAYSTIAQISNGLQQKLLYCAPEPRYSEACEYSSHFTALYAQFSCNLGSFILSSWVLLFS